MCHAMSLVLLSAHKIQDWDDLLNFQEDTELSVKISLQWWHNGTVSRKKKNPPRLPFQVFSEAFVTKSFERKPEYED